MHVLHLDTGREDRGGQRQVALLTRDLARAGHPATVAVPCGAPLAARLRGVAGVSVVELPLQGEISPAALPALARLLRGSDIALVHAHTAHAVTLGHLARLLAPRAGRGQRPPLLAHRRVDFPLARNLLARRKRRWPDAWIAVAHSVREQLVRDGIAPWRIFVVPSAIDAARAAASRPRGEVRAALGLRDDEAVLLSVGQLVAHKGHAVLVRALGALRREGARPSWLIAGEGPLRAALDSLARREGIAEQIRWLGPREDVPDLLGAIDLLLFPSISGEGSPAVPKEAMLLGVPLLCSDLPACRELGLLPDCLAPAGDAPAWAQRIATLLQALPAARASALQRVARAQVYRSERMAAATAAVYAQVLAARSGV
jgi:glycosyltransferase involved in cell wall biosynthesis